MPQSHGKVEPRHARRTQKTPPPCPCTRSDRRLVGHDRAFTSSDQGGIRRLLSANNWSTAKVLNWGAKRTSDFGQSSQSRFTKPGRSASVSFWP